jgi:hypothetical protein
VTVAAQLGCADSDSDRQGRDCEDGYWQFAHAAMVAAARASVVAWRSNVCRTPAGLRPGLDPVALPRQGDHASLSARA